MHFVRSCELRSYLKAGVTATHHQHRTRRKRIPCPVLSTVKLHHVRMQVGGYRWYARDLVWPSGEDDLVGLVGPVVELDEIATLLCTDGADVAVQLDRKREVAGVVGQVRDDPVPIRITI